VIAQVERELGAGYYGQLATAWQRVVAADPALRRTQWYRSPEQILRERARNPDAALLSQHGLGLAVDATPTEANRAAFIEAAKAQGFFVRTYTRNRHVHVAALSDAAWARRPLRNVLRARLGPLLAARD
jgi:hypothetical protein